MPAITVQDVPEAQNYPFIKIITVKCRPISVIYYTLEHAEHVAGNMLLIAIFKFLLILISRGGDTKRRSNLRTYKKCFSEIAIMTNTCISYVQNRSF